MSQSGIWTSARCLFLLVLFLPILEVSQKGHQITVSELLLYRDMEAIRMRNIPTQSGHATLFKPCLPLRRVDLKMSLNGHHRWPRPRRFLYSFLTTSGAQLSQGRRVPRPSRQEKATSALRHSFLLLSRLPHLYMCLHSETGIHAYVYGRKSCRGVRPVLSFFPKLCRNTKETSDSCTYPEEPVEMHYEAFCSASFRRSLLLVLLLFLRVQVSRLGRPPDE